MAQKKWLSQKFAKAAIFQMALFCSIYKIVYRKWEILSATTRRRTENHVKKITSFISVYEQHNILFAKGNNRICRKHKHKIWGTSQIYRCTQWVSGYLSWHGSEVQTHVIWHHQCNCSQRGHAIRHGYLPACPHFITERNDQKLSNGGFI